MQDVTLKITESTEQVLGVLVDGRATPGHIQRQTGLARNTIHTQLNALLAADAVAYVDEPTGLYELLADPRDDTDEDTGETSLEDLAWDTLPAADPASPEKLEYVIRKVREADQLQSGLTWRSVVVGELTVEEILGGLKEAEDVANEAADMLDRVAELESERDELREQVVTLQEEIADLESRPEGLPDRAVRSLHAARTALEGQSPDIDMAKAELDAVLEVIDDE